MGQRRQLCHALSIKRHIALHVDRVCRDQLQLLLVNPVTVLVVLQFRHAINLNREGFGVPYIGCDGDAVMRRAHLGVIEVYTLGFQLGDHVFHLRGENGVGEAFHILLQHLVLILVILPCHVIEQTCAVLIVLVQPVGLDGYHRLGLRQRIDVGRGVALADGKPLGLDAVGKGVIVLLLF